MQRRPRGKWRRFKHWLHSVHWVTARKVALVLAVLAVAAAVRGAMVQHGSFSLARLFEDLWTNLSTELASIAMTVLVIDTLNRRRAVAEEKQDLILQMGSPDNAFAREAVRKLRARGWGFGSDRSLLRQHLSKANLRDANLQGCSLEDAEVDAETVLPDNTYYQPQLGLEQMRRFTHPQHPDFWRSDNQVSPARRDRNLAV